jgi:hypothetical protein
MWKRFTHGKSICWKPLAAKTGPCFVKGLGAVGASFAERRQSSIITPKNARVLSDFVKINIDATNRSGDTSAR